MTLEEAHQHIGDAVVYDDGFGLRQDGTITGTGKQFVYVRYGHNDSSIKATRPQDLRLLSDTPGKITEASRG